MPKFYQTPKGTLSTSEKRWKDDMLAEGFDPKEHKNRNTFEVPTKAADLMEFLTFHNVNVVNPQGSSPAPEVAGSTQPPAPRELPAAPGPSTTVSLDELFAAAPIKQKIGLAVAALDAADARIAELGG